MPPQSKPARVKFLDVPPPSSETTATRFKRPKQQKKIDPANLRQSDAGAEKERASKTRPYRAVILKNVVHANDGSFRHGIGCYCLKRNVFFTTSNRPVSQLLDVERLKQRADRYCGHLHMFKTPYPLRTKSPVTWPKLSLRR